MDKRDIFQLNALGEFPPSPETVDFRRLSETPPPQPFIIDEPPRLSIGELACWIVPAVVTIALWFAYRLVLADICLSALS